MITAGIVVFARMTSTRLPGKTLMDIGGRTVLGALLDRLKLVRTKAKVIVATSDDPSDDAIADFIAADPTARNLGATTYRGPLKDVLSRAIGCRSAFGLDPLVRISGDSPFMDPAVIDMILNRHLKERPDITTNLFPRTFPKGISVEAISAQCLKRLDLDTRNLEDREHVTPYVYANPDRFTIINVAAPAQGLDQFALTIDTPEDLERARALISRLSDTVNPFDYRTCIELLSDQSAVEPSAASEG